MKLFSSKMSLSHFMYLYMTGLHTQVLSSVQFSYRLLCRGLMSARSSVQQLRERYISLILLSLRRHCHCWETESPKSLIISTSAYAALTHSFLLCISKGIHSQPRRGLQRDDKAPQPIKQRGSSSKMRGEKQEEKKTLSPFLLKSSTICSFFPFPEWQWLVQLVFIPAT